MNGRMTPLDAIRVLQRSHPDARLKSVVRKIERKRLLYFLWMNWLEDQIGRIVDENLREQP